MLQEVYLHVALPVTEMVTTISDRRKALGGVMLITMGINTSRSVRPDAQGTSFTAIVICPKRNSAIVAAGIYQNSISKTNAIIMIDIGKVKK